MAVIARYRAEEFYLIKFAPRRMSADTHCHRAGNRIKHYIQTGVAVDLDIFLRHFGHVCQQLSCLRNTIHDSVVSAVHTCLTYHI